MISFFKKKVVEATSKESEFELELIASVLAFEIARSDGEISESELNILFHEIKKISSNLLIPIIVSFYQGFKLVIKLQS